MQDNETTGWLTIAEQSFKEAWDNEKDKTAWKRYLKKNTK